VVDLQDETFFGFCGADLAEDGLEGAGLEFPFDLKQI
jgi:hypothetical protein